MAFHGKGLWKLAVPGLIFTMLSLGCAQAPAPAPTPAPGATAITPSKPSGDAAAGETVFQSQGCSACHQAKSRGGQVGPGLDGVYGSRVKLTNGQEVTADEAYIRESIVNPSAKTVAGYQPVMPSTFGSLSTQDLNNLIAFIASLTK